MLLGMQNADFTSRTNDQILTISHTIKPPKLDGKSDDKCWQTAKWYPLNQSWIGAYPPLEDFSGRFKLVYGADSLYLLAEINDDRLIDARPDPLDKYWDDDCLEIFLDPDASGGPHQFNHNAWAYHIALDGTTVDFGTDSLPHVYPHCFSRYKKVATPTGYHMTWEVAIAMHSADYQDAKGHLADENRPSKPKKGAQAGFALAWCDADDASGRQNFIGSVPVPGKDKNQGYKSAWIFGLAKFK